MSQVALHCRTCHRLCVFRVTVAWLVFVSPLNFVKGLSEAVSLPAQAVGLEQQTSQAVVDRIRRKCFRSFSFARHRNTYIAHVTHSLRNQLTTTGHYFFTLKFSAFVVCNTSEDFLFYAAYFGKSLQIRKTETMLCDKTMAHWHTFFVYCRIVT